MSKAAQIRALLELCKKPKEIAAEVGVHPGYIQAVKQRLRLGSNRPADKAWWAKNPDLQRARWRAAMKRRTLKKQQQRAEARAP